jgi:hypothetical protein
MAKDGGGFDFSAINGSMAKQLVKDMLAAFDADTNRKRLAKAILAARDDTDALMLKVLPLATAIASEALGRWGIEEDSEGNAFVEVMNALAKLAPADEFLSYDIYVLKCKFMPFPPVNRAPPPGKARQTRPKKPSLDDESAVSGLSR